MGTVKYMSSSAVGMNESERRNSLAKMKLVITLTIVSLKMCPWSVIHSNPLTIAFPLYFSKVPFCGLEKLIAHLCLGILICKMGGNAYLVQRAQQKLITSTLNTL